VDGFLEKSRDTYRAGWVEPETQRALKNQEITCRVPARVWEKKQGESYSRKTRSSMVSIRDFAATIVMTVYATQRR